MKWIFILIFLWGGAAHAAALEVRKYAVRGGDLGKALQNAGLGFDLDFEDEDWLGPVATDLPFKSRFIEGGKQWRDCRGIIERLVFRPDFEGAAVYNFESGFLVLKAEEEEHDAVEFRLQFCFERVIRTEVGVYAVPGVLRGRRAVFWSGPPKGAELLASVSCLHLPGQGFSAATGNGVLSAKVEAQFDMEDNYVDCLSELDFESGEMAFTLKSGFVSPLGVSHVLEIGSRDGEKTLLAVVRHDLVRLDGRLVDEWILKEKEGAFLKRERLTRSFLRAAAEGAPFDDARGFRVVPVSPDFIDSMAWGEVIPEGESDPFLPDDIKERERARIKITRYEGAHPELASLAAPDLFDCRKYYAELGVTFRKGDFVVCEKSKGRIYAKLRRGDLELLRKLAKSLVREPVILRVECLLLEMGDDQSGWKPGEGRVLKKVGVTLFAGSGEEVILGQDLALQIEALPGIPESTVEVRAVLSETGGDFEQPAFATGVTLESGKPVVIHESVIGGSRKLWVIRANVVKVSGELGGYLEMEKM